MESGVSYVISYQPHCILVFSGKFVPLFSCHDTCILNDWLCHFLPCYYTLQYIIFIKPEASNIRVQTAPLLNRIETEMEVETDGY